MMSCLKLKRLNFQWWHIFISDSDIFLGFIWFSKKKLEFKNQVQRLRFKIWLIIPQFVAKIVQILWYGPGIT
jgi:hypothetical protein